MARVTFFFPFKAELASGRYVCWLVEWLCFLCFQYFSIKIIKIDYLSTEIDKIDNHKNSINYNRLLSILIKYQKYQFSALIHEHCMCSHYWDWRSYSQTSPQWPPWGQKKLAVVEKWRLWGGRGVIWQIFLREYKMFIVLSSCLQYPIIVIQS